MGREPCRLLDLHPEKQTCSYIGETNPTVWADVPRTCAAVPKTMQRGQGQSGSPLDVGGSRVRIAAWFCCVGIDFETGLSLHRDKELAGLRLSPAACRASVSLGGVRHILDRRCEGCVSSNTPTLSRLFLKINARCQWTLECGTALVGSAFALPHWERRA